MTLTNKIGLSYGILLLVAIICAILTLWAVMRSQFHLERTFLAHQSYEAHLRLSLNAEELFNEMEYAILSGDRSESATEKRLIVAINEDVEFIRGVVSDEILLVGEEEIEELNEIAELKSRINQQILRYAELRETARADVNTMNVGPALAKIRAQRDPKITEEIQEALTGETAEVEEAREASLAMMARKSAIAVTLAIVAVLCAAYSILLILRELTIPLRKIVQGAQQFADGNFSHRINVSGDIELKKVADAVNNAARLAENRHMSLEHANSQLEKEVHARTSELRQTILSLEEQQIKRQQLLADVSHELRTPLTVIQGEADIALRGGEKEAATYIEALKRASEAAKHTAQLVNDVLFIGRQELGQAKLKLQRNDLVSLMKSTIESSRVFQDRRETAIEFDSDLEEAIVAIDANRMRQVIMVLLENACHYGGKHIWANISASPGGYSLSVRDDGPGISETEQSKVFERFFRGSNAGERYEAGTGLGLPVAKSIIEAHQGRISVSSIPGAGAEFSVYLPAKRVLRAVS